ncbi:MAG: DUF3575 domain-containing protein [Rikenellaceae bacterium]
MKKLVLFFILLFVTLSCYSQTQRVEVLFDNRDSVMGIDEIRQRITLYYCEQNRQLEPLFALKTNLLFDTASLINVEIEVPISESFSVAGEWIFPWWKWDNGKENSQRNRVQLLNANFEGKYWFGDRAYRPKLTGWFAGVYVGGGLYDFEWDKKGYQGEFLIAGGISGGYAHIINKSGSLRMEYSLGLGILRTRYTYYNAMYDIDNSWHAIKQRTGNYTWVGPTKAKVSLVWIVNRRVMKGGVQ